MLALKFPYGKAAWGGKFTVLPSGFRIASALSALMIVFVALCVLGRGGVLTVFNDTVVTWVVWVFAVYFGLNTLMNYNSQSQTEKKAMTPVAFSSFVLFLIVAITAG